MSRPTQRQPRELLNGISIHCMLFAYMPGLNQAQRNAVILACEDALDLWWSVLQTDLKALAASGQ